MADTFQAQAEEALCGVLAPAGRDEAELDMQFHYALIRATGNKVWICLMEAIMDIYREWIGEVMARATNLQGGAACGTRRNSPCPPMQRPHRMHAGN